MAIDPHGLLAAALSVRVTADTTGLDAEIASKLTAAERRAIQTSERVSSAAGRVAEVGAVSSTKLTAATLRQSAAQETYNRLLREGETDTVRLARAQASALTSRLAVERETARLTGASATRTAAAGEAGALGLLGGARGLVAGAAGLGAFAAIRGGVQTYERLTGAVRGYQRVTQQSAEESSRMVALLERFGLSGDRVNQMLVRFGRNIADKPELLRKYGADLARNADGTTNLTKTLLNANDAFHRTPDAATRASLAMTLFGRGGQALYPILNANKDALQGFMDEAERAGVVFSQKDLDRAKELAMAQKSLTEAWQGFEVLLARGVVPVLKDVDKFGTRALNLFTDHRTVGTAVLRIGEIAGGLYAVNRAIKTFDAVRGSALFTKVLNVGETEAQTVANYGLARSYAAVGAAAGAAIPEVAALSGVEAAGGGAGALGSMAALRATIPAGRASLLGRLGVAGGGLLRGAAFTAAAIDPVILASLLAGGDQTSAASKTANARQGDLLGQFSYRNGAYYAGNQKVTDPRAIAVLQSSGIGPALTDAGNAALQRRFGNSNLFSGSSAAVGGAQNRALAAVLAGATPAQQIAAGRSQLTQQGRQYASSIDIFSRAAPLTPHADPQATQALDTARTRAADAARRVTLDQQKLNALRATGKASTLQLAGAEETLRLAKERSAKASQDVTDAEKKAHAERLPTARSLLGTLTSQANRAGQDAKAVQRLYAEGLGPNVVAKIIAENANKPGALESIAKTLTPAMAKQMQAQFRHLQFDGSIIAGTPQEWRKAGNNRALDFMAGVQATFNNASPAVVRAHVAGVRHRIDSTEPVTSRHRQRALSGTPALPHGA